MMLNNLLWLLKLQVVENLQPKSFNFKRKKTTFAAFLTIPILLFVGCFLYIFFISKSVINVGYGNLLPNLTAGISILCIFIFTFLKSSSLIFFSKDTDFLMSLPIKASSIVISRVLSLYILNAFITLGFILPVATSLIIYTQIYSFAYFIMIIISVLFIPLIPIVFSTFFSTIIFLISSRFRSSNTINIILNLALMIIIPIFIIAGVKYNIINLSQISDFFTNSLILRYLIPFPMNPTNIYAFILSCLMSLLIFFVFICIISSNYKRILNALNSIKVISVPESSNSRLKITSDIKALYKKEILRYFSSPSYVLNTSIFTIALILFSLAILFVSPNQIEAFLDIPNFSIWISKFTPLVVSTLVALTCTTSISFSLEGKNIWILKALPIEASKIYISKVLVNLSITLPSLFIANVIFIIKLNLSFFDGILLFITPTIFTIFSSWLGLLFNLKFPNYDWKNEITVIKQSASVILTLLCNAISAGLLIGAISLINFIDWHIIIVAYSIILIFITAYLHKHIKKLNF